MPKKGLKNRVGTERSKGVGLKALNEEHMTWCPGKIYTSYEDHVEFIMMGARGDGKPDGYTNIGVYLQNRYEIQSESPKEKILQTPIIGRFDPTGLTLSAWTGCQFTMYGDLMDNGMLFTSF